jgi:hypothetical protein
MYLRIQILAMLALASLGFGQAIGTAPTDALQLGYASNLIYGDSVVNITNAGTLGGFSTGTGNLCANIYTFDPRQYLVSCCSCLVTPNALNSLSVRSDLISNTLTPAVPSSVSVAVVATTLPGNGICNAGSGASVNALTLAPGLRVWGTTLEPGPGGVFSVVSNHFQTAPLGSSELGQLTAFCGFIQAIGGGYGICRSCQVGALGGAKQ